MAQAPLHSISPSNGIVSLLWLDLDGARYTSVSSTLPSSLSGNTQIQTNSLRGARLGGSASRVLETPRMIDFINQLQKGISPQGQSTLIEATLDAVDGSAISSLSAVATGTGGHATATALNAYFSKFITVTAGSAENAILPSAGKWQVKVVVNAGASPLLIYPQTGEFINGIIDTTPFSLPVGASASFYTLINGGATKNWTSILWL